MIFQERLQRCESVGKFWGGHRGPSSSWESLQSNFVAAAESKHVDLLAELNAGNSSRVLELHLRDLYAPYHNDDLLRTALRLVPDFGPGTRYVFPCCGYAVTESAFLAAREPIRKPVFMDRLVTCRVYRDEIPGEECKTFEELTGLMQETDVVIGFNATTHSEMFKDPWYERFRAACPLHRTYFFRLCGRGPLRAGETMVPGGVMEIM